MGGVGLLPKPIYLSFGVEKEGDEYVARLEALLDRGVVPEEFVAPKTDPKRLRGRVSECCSKQAISVDDAKLLPVVLSRLLIEMAMADLTFCWVTEWVASMKRAHTLSPSTFRHQVGVQSRALDWLAAQGELPTNPLRLLPRGYSAYTADGAAVRA